MNVLEKIYAADEGRKSRLHDLQGTRVDPAQMAILPQRLIENLLARFGRYSAQPWWPPLVTQAVEEILRPDFNVVEFGSGMSTLWLARRVRQVTAVDINPAWKANVEQGLAARGLTNATVLERSFDGYLDVDVQGAIDLVIIDGERRADCLDWAIARLAPGAYIYLDNSDRDGGHDTTGARAKLLSFAEAGKVVIQAFRGYPPAQLAPTEGMLAKVAAL